MAHISELSRIEPKCNIWLNLGCNCTQSQKLEAVQSDTTVAVQVPANSVLDSGSSQYGSCVENSIFTNVVLSVLEPRSYRTVRFYKLIRDSYRSKTEVVPIKMF